LYLIINGIFIGWSITITITINLLNGDTEGVRIWVCPEMGHPLKMVFNRENDEKESFLGYNIFRQTHITK